MQEYGGYEGGGGVFEVTGIMCIDENSGACAYCRYFDCFTGRIIFHRQSGHALHLEKEFELKNWTQGWLTYRPGKDAGNARLLGRVQIIGFEEEQTIVQNALSELRKGVRGMLGLSVRLAGDGRMKNGLLILRDPEGEAEGYHIREADGILCLRALDGRGVLYGIFHILRLISMERTLVGIDVSCRPDNLLRMYDHWDNMDGSIERGYAGDSFFFRDEKVLVNRRTRDYCRLVSSVGINGVVINNVNVKGAATWLITDRYFKQLKKMAALFAGYGIRLFLSLNFAAPMELGGPDSADPLDKAVASWWRKTVARVYEEIPELGGFLVKADSEGRPGPFTYGRTQADGANMLADAVKPYGGIIIWRCFVYNCGQDWRDYRTDRARAAYDNFVDTDGDYRDNVILQIKNGPMDFQIREPVSPLFGALKKTSQMLEVQAAQEYTGQQIDVCYLIPMFQEALNFDTCYREKESRVSDLIKDSGICAVCNTGDDENWTGNALAGANFYGFGRLAYDTGLSADTIAEEWIRQTLSNDGEVVDKVKRILLRSRETYEKYTSPLGIGWMVTPGEHYGPSVDGYEYSRWGTYHRADWQGLGVDRTDQGTGYAQQYQEPNASMYNSAETCPENLLLFFHHLPYEYRLKSGKTIIQHIYDTHFEGVEEVEEMISLWKELAGKIEESVYGNVLRRFVMQLDNAREWRDQVNSYFYRKCGIPDEKGRRIY